MSSGILTFGDYTFPNVQRVLPDFVQLRTKIQTAPGMDGGFDVYGEGVAPTAPGRATEEFILISSTREGMDVLRDAVKTLPSYGVAKLIYQPTEPSDDERWCWARALPQPMRQDKAGQDDYWQSVTVNFEVSEACWYVDSYVGWKLGDGYALGDTDLLIGEDPDGNGPYEIAASGASTDDSIDNDGNVTAIPKITVEPQSGQTCENPVIQRLQGNYVADEVAWEGTLTYGDILVINGRTQDVTYNAVKAWDDFDYDHPSLFRLLPGSNSIRVIFENGGDAATVRFFTRDKYR